MVPAKLVLAEFMFAPFASTGSVKAKFAVIGPVQFRKFADDGIAETMPILELYWPNARAE